MELTINGSPKEIAALVLALQERLKRETRLPLGNIVEQCIDYALENLEKEVTPDE